MYVRHVSSLCVCTDIYTIISAIALNVTEPVNCQALYTYNQVPNLPCDRTSQSNLSLCRFSAMLLLAWRASTCRSARERLAIVILVRRLTLSFQGRCVVTVEIPNCWPRSGHHGSLVAPSARSVFRICVQICGLSLSRSGLLIKAEWIPGSGCAITNTDNTLLAATFIYSMCFDFTVLVLTAWKLAWPTKRSERTKLVSLIFGDGLIFFFIAFMANLGATVSRFHITPPTKC